MPRNINSPIASSRISKWLSIMKPKIVVLLVEDLDGFLVF